jgi:hypothetical protein
MMTVKAFLQYLLALLSVAKISFVNSYKLSLAPLCFLGLTQTLEQHLDSPRFWFNHVVISSTLLQVQDIGPWYLKERAFVSSSCTSAAFSLLLKVK